MKTLLSTCLTVPPALSARTTAMDSDAMTTERVTSSKSESARKKATTNTLDSLVREYFKAARSADSVDALTEFLPASRVKNFKDECT